MAKKKPEPTVKGTAIKVEPNYDNMLKAFIYDTKAHMAHLSNRGQSDFSRSEVYNLVQAIRMSLLCCTTTTAVVEYRDLFCDLADKMFKEVQREQTRPRQDDYDLSNPTERLKYERDVHEWEKAHV